MPVGFEPQQEKVPLAPEHILRVVNLWQETTKLMIWVTRNRREEPSTKFGSSLLERETTNSNPVDGLRCTHNIKECFVISSTIQIQQLLFIFGHTKTDLYQ